jgi:hypothetical protein
LKDEDGYEPSGEVSMYPMMSGEGILREILRMLMVEPLDKHIEAEAGPSFNI